jgi:hypothetical protein
LDQAQMDLARYQALQRVRLIARQQAEDQAYDFSDSRNRGASRGRSDSVTGAGRCSDDPPSATEKTPGLQTPHQRSTQLTFMRMFDDASAALSPRELERLVGTSLFPATCASVG